MTAPLTPAGCDLRDFPHTPLFRSRLFGSSFHARATDSEWRAGVTLWLKSWDQVPAGSLPDDDIELCRLAELAKDMKTWRKVRDGALRGWALCRDGRLYHPVVAEGINNAIEAKAAQRAKTAKARIAALEKHLAKAVKDQDADAISRLTDEIAKLKQPLLQQPKASPTESVAGSVTGTKGREGEGKGRDSSSEANASGGEPPNPDVDPAEAIFALGLPLLLAANVPDKNARSMLGFLRKANGDAAVLEAIQRCAEQKPLQPVEFLQGCLKSAKTAAGKHAGFATKDYREGVTTDGTFA